MKNIATQNCILDCVFAQITTSPKTDVKINGNAVYSGSLDIQISGYTSEVITVAGSGSGSGSLQPSAQYVKIDGEAVVLEEDSVDITVNGQAISGITTIPVSEVVTVKIISAGQSLVKGD